MRVVRRRRETTAAEAAMGKGIGDDENEKLIWGSGSMKRDTQMVLERERERGGENLFVCVSGCGKVECDGDRFLR